MPDTLGRQHLVNKQDVHNIENQFNVDRIGKHASDSESIHAWVQELQSGDYKPVILYKVQDSKELTIGESKAFEEDYALCLMPYALCLVRYALCIQTEFLCDMLKFGIDFTRSTNHYDFPLTTLMVID